MIVFVALVDLKVLARRDIRVPCFISERLKRHMKRSAEDRWFCTQYEHRTDNYIFMKEASG